MGHVYRFQLTGSEPSLQADSQPPMKKGPAREIVYLSPDTRRAIWDMLYRHGQTAQKISRVLGVTQQQITSVIHARVPEEIDKAVLADRNRRGPFPPAPAMRRHQEAA